jgi:hypothetical protein
MHVSAIPLFILGVVTFTGFTHNLLKSNRHPLAAFLKAFSANTKNVSASSKKGMKKTNAEVSLNFPKLLANSKAFRKKRRRTFHRGIILKREMQKS